MLQSLKENQELPVKQAAKLLEVHSTNFYYDKQRKNLYVPLYVKNAIDRIHVDYPGWGFRRVSKELQSMGYTIHEYQVKKFMTEMAIHAVYSNFNNGTAKNLFPYLLHNLTLCRINQVWNISITYIKLKTNFAYLTVIIDYYSMVVIGWEIDELINVKNIITLLEKAFQKALPEIINSDQGIPFNSSEYIYLLKSNNIMISMNNKYQWTNDIANEWIRKLKIEEVYINDYSNIEVAKRFINSYILNYNQRINS